jgi:hypothetical protein
MKAWQYLVTVVLGAACLILALAVIKTGKANQGLQTELQRQQMDINNAQRVMQMGNSILQDMGFVATRNEKMHKLLGDNGWNIQVQATPPAATGTTSPKKAVTQ